MAFCVHILKVWCSSYQNNLNLKSRSGLQTALDDFDDLMIITTVSSQAGVFKFLISSDQQQIFRFVFMQSFEKKIGEKGKFIDF